MLHNISHMYEYKLNIKVPFICWEEQHGSQNTIKSLGCSSSQLDQKGNEFSATAVWLGGAVGEQLQFPTLKFS